MSVKRAIELIGAFMQPPHRFGLTELSKATGQTKNQTFRLLQTLVDEGVVEVEADTKRYSLGYRVLEWGFLAYKGSPLTVAASPVLDHLREEFGETVVLTARTSGLTAICVDKRESSHALQISAQIGRRVPLHAGAGSKCILAFSGEEFIERFLHDAAPLKRYTERTITGADELREELRRIREQGVSISDEDLDPGACSISAPITDHSGQVVAAVSLASPKVRFTDNDVDGRRQPLKDAAQQISRRMTLAF